MKDTLRILVSWKCNLRCPYCCNDNPRFRKDITPTAFEDIQWDNYENFCISGGEPLLHMGLVEKVVSKIPAGKSIFFYTNGTLMTPELAKRLETLGVEYVNVGLHSQATYADIINKVQRATEGTKLQVRYHAQNIHEKMLRGMYPKMRSGMFRFWMMDDCDRNNEDRIVLKESC